MHLNYSRIWRFWKQQESSKLAHKLLMKICKWFHPLKENFKYEICHHCLLSSLITLSLSVWLSPRPHSTPVWEIEQNKLSEEPLPVVYLRSLSCDSVSWGGCAWGQYGEGIWWHCWSCWCEHSPPSHHSPTPHPDCVKCWLSQCGVRAPKPCTTHAHPRHTPSHRYIVYTLCMIIPHLH